MNDSKIEESDIIGRIQTLYPDAIVDLEGADCSFEVYVISENFEGIATLQRQKSILALFKDDITSGRLHALSVKARTPQEQAGAAGLVQLKM